MRARNLKIFKLSFAAIVNHFAVYHPNITGTAHWAHCVSVGGGEEGGAGRLVGGGG